MTRLLSRRDFLKTGALGAGALIGSRWLAWGEMLAQFPDAERLGRNCLGGKINIRAKPSANATVVREIYEDTVLVWLREVLGEAPMGVLSRSWVETPEGYIYAPSLQPVRNLPNQPLATLPGEGATRGAWMEVTIPYVDLELINPPASPWLKAYQEKNITPRLYYSQVMWIDDIRTNNQGMVQYRVGERFGSYGDIFWVDAAAFRPITAEEIAPIHPEVTDKRVVVDLNHQTMSCMEGNNEVYFCRISSGAKFNAAGEAVDNWSTPPGPHPIWRKLVSIHMAGGGTGAGWDTPGIAWTSLFSGDGVAIHSTFWHNDFGSPRSHGCVNALPEDSKWVFRWTNPAVNYEPGDLTIEGMTSSTIVDIVAAEA